MNTTLIVHYMFEASQEPGQNCTRKQLQNV